MIYYKNMILILYVSYLILSALYSFFVYKTEQDKRKRILKWSVCGLFCLVNFFSIRDVSYLINYMTLNFNFTKAFNESNYMNMVLVYIFQNSIGNFFSGFEFISLISLTIFMSITCKKYFYQLAKIDRNMEVYQWILQGCFVFLSFGIYGIVYLFNYYKETNKTGTFRELITGNDVIRNPLESHARLQKMFGELEKDGIEIFENIHIPKRLESYNFLFTGSMGSGKTVILMKALMQFYELQRTSIILDNKGDFCERIGEKAGVVILSPFDVRSVAWNVAIDIVTEIDAYEFVSYLIQGKGSGSKDFFIKAARDVALGAIKYLQATKPKLWTLIDILRVTEQPNILEILSKYHSGALNTLKDAGVDITSGTMSVGSQSAGIFGEIRAELFILEFIAKAWPDTSNGISIKKIARQEDKKNRTIIVPYMQKYVEISGYFSSMIINLFLKELMSLPDSFERRVGVFLDEIGVVSRIKSLPDALKLSRSKGICIFAAFQDFGVIRTKYDMDGGTETIVGGFAFQLLGRSQSPEYAEYVVRLFGKNAYKKIKRTQSIDSKGKKTISQSEDVVIEDAIASGELSSIPTAGKKNPPTFFLKCSEFPFIYKVQIPILTYEKLYETHIPAPWLTEDFAIKLTTENLQKNQEKEASYIHEIQKYSIENIDQLTSTKEGVIPKETKQEVEKSKSISEVNSANYLNDLGF